MKYPGRVVDANNQGVPFVLASPEAQASRDITAMAASLLQAPAPVAARR